MGSRNQVSAKALEIAVMILGPNPSDFQNKDDVDRIIRDYLDLASVLDQHIDQGDQD